MKIKKKIWYRAQLQTNGVYYSIDGDSILHDHPDYTFYGPFNIEVEVPDNYIEADKLKFAQVVGDKMKILEAECALKLKEMDDLRQSFLALPVPE